MSVAALAFSLLAVGPAADESQMQEAAKSFRSRCMNCHVMPDLDFATDRGWLKQVKDTA